jgi:hypothetical protein
MRRNAPPCDKHPNLQMVESWIESNAGRIPRYICVVPGCSRQHDGRNYLDNPESALLAKSPHKNRLASARNAILKAIGHR